MDDDYTINELENFLKESPIFVSIHGSYNISDKMFIDAFKEYKKTKKNILIEHQTLTFISWEGVSYDSWLTDNQRGILISCLNEKSHFHYSEFFDRWEDALEILKTSDSLKTHYESYPKLRQKANAAISKKSTRKEVFSRDGYKCVLCSSTSNLSLDHIRPVSKGGDNDLSNLQTLCRSCNSSKGSKYNE